MRPGKLGMRLVPRGERRALALGRKPGALQHARLRLGRSGLEPFERVDGSGRERPEREAGRDGTAIVHIHRR